MVTRVSPAYQDTADFVVYQDTVHTVDSAVILDRGTPLVLQWMVPEAC